MSPEPRDSEERVKLQGMRQRAICLLFKGKGEEEKKVRVGREEARANETVGRLKCSDIQSS